MVILLNLNLPAPNLIRYSTKFGIVTRPVFLIIISIRITQVTRTILLILSAAILTLQSHPAIRLELLTTVRVLVMVPTLHTKQSSRMKTAVKIGLIPLIYGTGTMRVTTSPF